MFGFSGRVALTTTIYSGPTLPIPVRRHPPTPQQPMFQNIHNTMSTMRGVAFFAALLLIVAAPFDAVLGAAEHVITACPTYDAPSLANSTHIAGEVPPPGHDTGDESEINANTHGSNRAGLDSSTTKSDDAHT